MIDRLSPLNVRYLLFLVVFASGCELRQPYLDPHGAGVSRTVGNPCPYAYRRMEVKSKRDPELRVSVAAFWKGEYRLKGTTVFIVIADRELLGYQVAQFSGPPLRRPRQVSFPSGNDVTIHVGTGAPVVGKLDGTASTGLIQNALILSVPVSDDLVNDFAVSIPPIEIDGETFQLGTVTFTRASETFHVANC